MATTNRRCLQHGFNCSGHLYGVSIEDSHHFLKHRETFHIFTKSGEFVVETTGTPEWPTKIYVTLRALFRGLQRNKGKN